MAENGSQAERFTDEEYAFLRYVRFGELPPRVLPSEMVEEVDTEHPHEIPRHLGLRPSMYIWMLP